MSDWIKLHRSVMESYSFANPIAFKIWVWMLLKANYKDSFIPLKIGRGSTTIKLKRGQFIFGRFKAEEELGIDGSVIYRQVKKFEELEQIIIESNSQYSIITICNFDNYQSIKDNTEQPKNNQRTTKEQPRSNIRTTKEHSIEELESIEEKESKEETPQNKLWFLQYYHSPYQTYKNAFNGQSTTEEYFNQWRQFIDFIYENKYDSLFECKFLSPHSFGILVEKSNFTKDKWDATLKKILSTGIKPEHDLFFRIPDFMGYVKGNTGIIANRELSEHEKKQIARREAAKGLK
jgi:hypothetical protein